MCTIPFLSSPDFVVEGSANRSQDLEACWTVILLSESGSGGGDREVVRLRAEVDFSSGSLVVSVCSSKYL